MNLSAFAAKPQAAVKTFVGKMDINPFAAITGHKYLPAALVLYFRNLREQDAAFDLQFFLRFGFRMDINNHFLPLKFPPFSTPPFLLPFSVSHSPGPIPEFIPAKAGTAGKAVNNYFPHFFTPEFS
jgi:hypothetical protein